MVYSNQIATRVLLDAEPNGMVTSLLVTVTVPLFAVTPVTIGPLPDSTTFVDVNLSCLDESIALYAPSTYDAVATTDVLSISPSAMAGDVKIKAIKI